MTVRSFYIQYIDIIYIIIMIWNWTRNFFAYAAAKAAGNDKKMKKVKNFLF